MVDLDDRAFALSEGLEPDDFVVATYLFQGAEEEDHLAVAVSAAMEQTVGRSSYAGEATRELVEARGGRLISYFRVPDHESKSTLRDVRWTATIARIAFPVANLGFQIPMLLTALMGDLSLGGMVKLVDLDLPASFLRAFAGPKFGLQGVRSYLGTDRPLVCSILKPCVGLSAKEASDIFYQHARGGADVIKDDETMAYDAELRVEDRVRACMQAAKRVFEETGHRVLYLTSITDRPDVMLAKALKAVEAGANGLMLTPLSTGISALQMLAEDLRVNVPLFAHPALLGATSWSPDFGISAHILGAKLVRLAGADINAFPVPYGRFAHLRESYIKLLKFSKAPMGHIKPCITQVGGGLHAWVVPDVIRDVGRDVMLVIGGTVQQHPMGLAAGVMAVRQAVTATLEGRALEEAAKQYAELGAIRGFNR